MCFDLTSLWRFKHIENWIKNIKDAYFTGQPILVGSKKDLVSKRQVSKSEIEKLARKWKLHYFETSSKTGENVEAAFLKLGKIIHNYHMKHKDDKKNEEVIVSKTVEKEKKCILS